MQEGLNIIKITRTHIVDQHLGEMSIIPFMAKIIGDVEHDGESLSNLDAQLSQLIKQIRIIQIDNKKKKSKQGLLGQFFARIGLLQ